ncbi:MAG: type II CRISPR RNA-guided endonuclease Cas9, partial [Nitrospinales bacterium]
MPFILGLDLGTNSIGWACIDANNEKVLGLGSRIFQEGVNRETKGKEISKNAIRRQARQSRKQYYRKRIRKEKLKIFLKNFGMFPDKKEGECEFFKLNPYCLRKRGLDEKLTKWEFGRILYHINQRRGFKSNRKSQKEKEDGVVKEATTQLQQEIKGNHCRTLGEYLALLNPAVDRIRKRYTLRKMYEEEFDLLWENQKEFHSDFSSEMKKKLKDEIIFYQGPLISVAKLIGPCSLEPTKKRTPKSSFEFQKYRILEQVNRLTFIDEDGVIREFFRSPDEEFEESIQKKREKLLAELYRKKDRDFSQIRKLLDLPKNTVFNLEKGGSKKLIGNRTEVQLSGLFGKTWWKFTGDQKEKIFQTIINAKDSEWLTQYAENKWGLGSEKAQQLGSKIHFESGYAHLSRKAIKNLLPHLENGLSFAGAKEKAGYGSLKNQRNIQEILENLRNPIVSQTLYELVRLLKVIEQNFGKPKMVRVELARELKLSADKRNKIQFENIDREKNNQRIREDLEQKRIKPTYDAVLRYKLWEECKETCPYTGAKISFADLFSETPQFQIEHIIPFPRSGDDSYMNKTLCRVDENERKGNRTPFEAYHGTEQFEQILRRLKDLHLPYPKQRKFQQKEIGEDFIK